MRCKACNSIMPVNTRIVDGVEVLEEVCNKCQYAYHAAEDQHEYEHGELTSQTEEIREVMEAAVCRGGM